MAIENLYFLDEVGVSQLAEAILSKSNARISERIVQEVNDASDHDHVPSALLLNALLKARDQQISSNKAAIDANKTSADAIKENVTTLSDNVTANTIGITSATEEITKLSAKVDAFTHLTIDVVIGAITDVQNPSTEILYIQKDDENATICSLWIYRGDSVWIRIGDTTIDLSGYWKKTDTDSIKGLIEVPDVTPMGDKGIQDIVEQAFSNTNVLKPPTPEDFIVTQNNRSEIGFTGAEGEELNIPETFTGTDRKLYKVVAIGTNAFYGCKSLNTVVIPNTVNKIERTAFNSSGIKSITIPANVKVVDTYAFAGCSSLTSIEISEGVEELRAGAFNRCASLTSITLPNTITTLSDDLFSRCTSLTSVKLPNRLISIEDYAFDGCSTLTEINIPNSVTTIGDYAFSNCPALKTINIDNVKDSISGSPWGATASTTTVNWLRTPPQ